MLNPQLKKKISSVLKNKIVLVTGGNGSFGRTIVKELIKFSPREIGILSRTEDKQVTMMHTYGSQKNLKL